jgi:hypothetical protein
MTDMYEARGPHLPDVMTRQSPWVYVFVAAALVHVWLALQQLSGRGVTPGLDDVYQVSFRINDVLISLFGAALFIRHPNARRSLPLLAFGLGLMALGPLLNLVDTPVMLFLDSLAPSDTGFIARSPAVIAYKVLTSLVAIAAVFCVGVGLAHARQRPRHPAERPVLTLVMLIGIASVLLALIPLGTGRLPATQYEWVLLGIGFVLSLLDALAWSYVIAVAFGGWIAGDAPYLGWGLALAASAMGLVVRAMFILIGYLSEPLSSDLLPVVSVAVTLSWLLLLVAFALGLPATADPQEATPPGSAAD